MFQMRARTLKKYFGSYFNLLDLLGYNCGMTWMSAFLTNLRTNLAALEGQLAEEYQRTD